MTGRALASIGPTLSKLIPMLSSNHDGEIVATVRAIERTLRGAGRDWHDLAGAVTGIIPAASTRSGWRDELCLCAQQIDRLSPREADFVCNLASSTRWREPTAKQEMWLHAIASRLREASR